MDVELLLLSMFDTERVSAKPRDEGKIQKQKQKKKMKEKDQTHMSGRGRRSGINISNLLKFC